MTATAYHVTTMRTSLTLFIAALALAALPHTALANDPPAPAPPSNGQTAQTPAPQPPAPGPSSQTPAPLARKPEEERAGLFARLRAYTKGTDVLANDIAGLQSANAQLQARIKELESGAALKALQDENAAMRADIAAFVEYAQTHGLDPKEPAAPQSPMGMAAGAAVAGAVATQLASLGVPTAQLPEATSADGRALTLADVEEQLKACKSDRERQALLTKHRDIILASAN